MFKTKKKIAIITLLFLALLFILGKNYIIEVAKSPSIRIHLINIVKVAIPLKNLILMRNIDDKIALLKSSGSCAFCDLTQGDFKGSDLEDVDLRYAILIGANLSNVNLNGAILHHVNLSGANLDGVDLRNKNLTGANLSGVDLINKDLTGTILVQSNLSGANLDGVDLSNKDLTGANLTGVDLRNKDLTGVNLKEVDLRNKDLTGVNLSGVDLSNKDLTGVNLSGANLSGVNLSGVNLSGLNLSRVNLSGVDLRNKDLTGVNLSGVNLSGLNLSGVNLSGANLSGVNLSGVDLRNKDLTGVNLTGVDLRNKDLTGVNLSGVDLRNKDLTGVNLSGSNLSGVNLSGSNLSGVNLFGVNLSGVDLSNKDLTGTILRLANLSGANLDGVDLRNKDLTGVNLSGVDLRNKDLTGTITEGAKKIEISLKNPSNSNFPASNEIQNLNVTKYDLSGDVQYLTTKEGFLFESKNNESILVLDLNKDALFPFTDFGYNGGLLGVASNEEFVYISYTSKGPDFDIEGDKGKGVDIDFSSLVVDEYSIDFKNVRNIIKIDGFLPTHYGGTLVFDQQGRLYLSTGDGAHYYQSNNAQNLNSLRGKILRLDVSKLKQDPEIVAFGLRNPFGVTIDSRNRMFIVQCGNTVETVYLLNDLYSGIPVNFGWRVFAGSHRDIIGHPLMFKDVLAPIFEYSYRPGCATGGVYLDDIESFLFGDFHGTIRLLKQQENGDWYLVHEYKQENNIFNFGLDNKTKKIFVAPNNLELEISVEQVKLNQ